MTGQRRMVSVLGSTGSIGVNTLDVIARHRSRFGVFALAANSSVDAMLAQCLACEPRYAVMMEEAAAESLCRKLPATSPTEVLQGEAGLSHVVTAPEVDAVMAAIVGAAGLPSTLAAARAGKTLLLANKESLVMGGHLLMQAVRESGARLLPIDSEHNAIFQCMPVDGAATTSLKGVSKVLLTASGGPFRNWSLAQMQAATPDQACAHPNWSMGRKISVDSASLMNKGLEFIEACWIFDLAPDMVEVVVHPQSIIHSMVQYRDGSVLAQMGNPDMRTPIAYGLGWPDRLVSGVAPLDLVATARLDFEAPDEQRFPCLRLAREAVAAGGTAMAVCNAANEVAVAAFLDRQIRFTDIPLVIERTLEQVSIVEPATLSVVEAADAEARDHASGFLVDIQNHSSSVATARLDFEAPDEQRFPCLRLAREAVAAGGTAMAVCNAANEVAVTAFLDRQIRFTDIPLVIERTLEQVSIVEPTTLSVVEAADAEARANASGFLVDVQKQASTVNRI